MGAPCSFELDCESPLGCHTWSDGSLRCAQGCSSHGECDGGSCSNGYSDDDFLDAILAEDEVPFGYCEPGSITNNPGAGGGMTPSEPDSGGAPNEEPDSGGDGGSSLPPESCSDAYGPLCVPPDYLGGGECGYQMSGFGCVPAPNDGVMRVSCAGDELDCPVKYGEPCCLLAEGSCGFRAGDDSCAPLPEEGDACSPTTCRFQDSNGVWESYIPAVGEACCDFTAGCGYSFDGVCIACKPNFCQGRECGTDGCGSSCGQCPFGVECMAEGICCDCGPGGTCLPDGTCDTCVPRCAPLAECGDDGCGGECGDGCVAPMDEPPSGENSVYECLGGEEGNGRCFWRCRSSCDGVSCGQPDGCGGTCGCEGGTCFQGTCDYDPPTGTGGTSGGGSGGSGAAGGTGGTGGSGCVVNPDCVFYVQSTNDLCEDYAALVNNCSAQLSCHFVRTDGSSGCAFPRPGDAADSCTIWQDGGQSLDIHCSVDGDCVGCL